MYEFVIEIAIVNDWLTCQLSGLWEPIKPY